MNVLESPVVEALVLGYGFFFAVVSKLWASISTLCQRRTRCSEETDHPPMIKSEPPSPPKCSDIKSPRPVITPSDESVEEEAPSFAATKGKFAVYYDYCYPQHDGGSERKTNSAAAAAAPASARDDGVSSCSSWEMVVVKRGCGEMEGWYGCLDLRVINGSVVRLWDHGRTLRNRSSTQF